MRTSAYLLIGTAAVALSTQSLAQTTQEDTAQAANALAIRSPQTYQLMKAQARAAGVQI